jgi:vacuolar protein sorting-associated protein VTA1
LSSAQATNDFLIALMNKLEGDKGQLAAPPTKAAGQNAVLATATGIFAKADEEDRAGFADKNTARTFYMAACFFDVLLQFGELEEEVSLSRILGKGKVGVEGRREEGHIEKHGHRPCGHGML